jgi:hypothetical protein
LVCSGSKPEILKVRISFPVYLTKRTFVITTSADRSAAAIDDDGATVFEHACRNHFGTV